VVEFSASARFQIDLKGQETCKTELSDKPDKNVSQSSVTFLNVSGNSD
jgi:hypothetical protein